MTVEAPEGLKEFEAENLPQILRFVKATLVFISRNFDDGYIPPFIISYGLGKYGSAGFCEIEDGEVAFVVFDVFSGDLLDTICHEYAHAIGYDEEQATAMAKEWSDFIRGRGMAS